MTTSYATVAELREQTDKQNNEAGKPSSDANLQLLLNAATNALNNLCNRPDGFVAGTSATARVYAGNGRQHLYIDECVSISSVGGKPSPSDSTYDAWVANDWIACRGDPDAPEFNSLLWADPRPYDGLIVSPYGSQVLFTNGSYSGAFGFPNDMSRGAIALPTVQVTAKWGFAVVCPAAIKEACLAQAARWFKRGEAFWSDMLSSPDMGVLNYTKAMDPDIVMMIKLGRFIKPPVGRR